MSLITLPYEWRIRAKTLDIRGADVLELAAKDLEKTLKESRDQADECRRILEADAPAYKQIDELRSVLFAGSQTFEQEGGAK